MKIFITEGRCGNSEPYCTVHECSKCYYYYEEVVEKEISNRGVCHGCKYYYGCGYNGRTEPCNGREVNR